MWFESTFILSMLTTFLLVSVVVFTGVFKYMPHHLVFLNRRTMYYLWGQVDDPRFVWQWLGFASGKARLGAVLNAAGGGCVEL